MNSLVKSIVLMALAGAMLPACDYLPFGYTKIAEVTGSPATFEGKEVRMRGVASPMLRIPFTDTSSYQLKDATGEITVLTLGQMPKQDEEVVVRGRVENIVIVAGQSLGVTLKEQSRTKPPF